MKKFWNYIITFIVGIGIALMIWYYKRLFYSTNIYDTITTLSDGCFVSGVLLTGFGLLIVISNIGNFDMIIYGLHNIVSLFKPNSNEDRVGKSFYDYRMNKSDKTKNVPFILHVGILYLVLAAVFTTVFYKLN